MEFVAASNVNDSVVLVSLISATILQKSLIGVSIFAAFAVVIYVAVVILTTVLT